MKLTEEMITEWICNHLSTYKGAQLNRIAPSGFFKNGRMIKHKSIFIKPGVSDIQFIYKNMFYAFEVKTPNEYDFVVKHHKTILDSPYGKLSKKKQHLKRQFEYIHNIRKNGFIAHFVCSVNMTKEIIDRTISDT